MNGWHGCLPVKLFTKPGSWEDWARHWPTGAVRGLDGMEISVLEHNALQSRCVIMLLGRSPPEIGAGSKGR